MFSWPLNGKTYLIRGRQYWRYDEAAARPDPGYPRDLSLWEGAPPAPDDVTVSNTGGRARAPGGPSDGGPGVVGWWGLQSPGWGEKRCGERGLGGGQAWTSPSNISLPAGDTYFFKGVHYWRFPRGSIKAEPDSPQPMGPKFLDCPAPSVRPPVLRPPRATLKPGDCDCQCEISQAAGRPSVLLLPLLSLLVGGLASP